MSFSDVGIKEDCCYRLGFESGPDIELVRWFDREAEEEFLRVSSDDLGEKAFEPLIKEVINWLNTTRQRMPDGTMKRTLLDDRPNPRYGLRDVRNHLVVYVSEELEVGKKVRLRCKVTSTRGLVSVEAIEYNGDAFGNITECIAIEPPSLPRRI